MPTTTPRHTCPNAAGHEGRAWSRSCWTTRWSRPRRSRGCSPPTRRSRGSFTKASATLLANQLKYGALPLTFEQGDLNTISATLGTDYLKAGLLAAGIGMLLVIVYGFFYYRLLGTVIFLSLGLSALLTFGMLVLLGREIGFTLTLAGIAGFIVSLGVAADSFVIYFERLKDEIREGRSPRSAVPRAWVRARRTIITANVVSILAAVVLYVVGVVGTRLRLRARTRDHIGPVDRVPVPAPDHDDAGADPGVPVAAGQRTRTCAATRGQGHPGAARGPSEGGLR